jgi:hypothetical protein
MSPLAAVRVDPLHQLEGNSLGTFEEPKPPTDVVHLIAQHVHPVGHQVAGHRGNIIDAQPKVVVAPSPQIRWVLTRIFRRPWIELEQLDLEARLGSFECKRDVLSLHIRHAHVSRRRTTIDSHDVLLPEAKELEEFDRGRSVRHREGYDRGCGPTSSSPSIVGRPDRSVPMSVLLLPAQPRIGISTVSQYEWARGPNRRRETIMMGNRWIAILRAGRPEPALRRTYAMLAPQLFRATA